MSDPSGTTGPVYGEVPRYGYQLPSPPPAPPSAPFPQQLPYPDPSQPPYQPLAPGAGPAAVSPYASWLRRVGAFAIDLTPTLIALVPFMIGYALSVGPLLTGDSAGLPFGGSAVWLGVGSLLLLAALGWQAYNRWVVAGRTGQSLGRRRLGVRLVAAATGRPIGALNACARDMLHIMDGVCVVGFLWPVRDRARQTFADKLMRTVVIVDPATAPRM